MEDLVKHWHLLLFEVLQDIDKRIGDWLASGGKIKDSYIKQQFKYAERFLREVQKMNKCFADVMGSCTALKQKNCKGCGFYKTYTQLEISKKRAMRRLKTLDKPTRLAIAEKQGMEGIL